MAAIKDIFQIVHALGLKTFTPSKWNEVKFQYGF
jgi:acid stress-induced BolA-like protein IbaG/YrbA